MRPQDEETDDFSVVFVQHFADGEEVAERFRHLLVIHPHETVVHPVIDEGAAMRALGLRDLVLVMRKLQVLATAVDVELPAQQLGAHRRAFDVPARPPWSPE